MMFDIRDCPWIYDQIKDGNLTIHDVVAKPNRPPDLTIPETSGFTAISYWEKENIVVYDDHRIKRHGTTRVFVSSARMRLSAREYIEYLYHETTNERHPYVRDYIDKQLSEHIESAIHS